MGGLEISQTTQKGWRPSKLTCQVLAALQQRIARVSNAVQRDAVLKDMALWLETRQQHTVQDLVAESFGLNAQHAAPIPEHLSAVGAEDIPIKAAGADAQETTMELLQESFVEDSLHLLSLGTKEALTLGLHCFGMMHRALQKDPAVLSKMSATLYAISDLFGHLKARQCHAVMHGRTLRGQLALWRCPSQLPWDFELWESVPIPSSRPAPSNCIVVPRAGNDQIGRRQLRWGPVLRVLGRELHRTPGGHRCVSEGTGRAWF